MDSFGHTQQERDYSTKLTRIRKRLYMAIALIPGSGIASYAVSRLCSVLGINTSFPESCVLLGGFGMLLWCLFRYGSSVCPRCSKPFFTKGSYINAFSRKCLNCGLPLHPRSKDEWPCNTDPGEDD